MIGKRILFLFLFLVGIYETGELLTGTQHWIDAMISVVFLSLAGVIYYRWLK